MKNSLSLMCSIAVMFLVGCIGSPPKQESTTSNGPFIMPTMPANRAPSQSVFNTQTKETSGQRMFPTSSQTMSAGATALNPAHGQPGHRCDIAVGAPLNGPLQQVQQPMPTAAPTMPAAQPMPTAQTMPAASPQLATASATKAGMNPPHGQPNHRCDIAVGAPLSSPRAAAAQSVSAAPQTTKVAPGMNPPHGQPNHRCDIAVGAPLTSAASPAQQPTPALQSTPAQPVPTAPLQWPVPTQR